MPLHAAETGGGGGGDAAQLPHQRHEAASLRDAYPAATAAPVRGEEEGAGSLVRLYPGASARHVRPPGGVCWSLGLVARCVFIRGLRLAM